MAAWASVLASTLSAAGRRELAQLVTRALAESAKVTPDENAHLAGHLLVATWTVALLQGYQTFRETRDAGQAKAAFLAMIDRGTTGIQAALAGLAEL